MPKRGELFGCLYPHISVYGVPLKVISDNVKVAVKARTETVSARRLDIRRYVPGVARGYYVLSSGWEVRYSTFCKRVGNLPLHKQEKNVLTVGNHGCGKKHMTIVVRQKACEQGLNVKFKNAATLSTELVEARDNYLPGKL